MSAVVELAPGMRVLTDRGPALVVAIERHGARIRNALGEDQLIRWDQLVVRRIDGDGVQAVHRSLEPWWSSLTQAARDEALFRLEVVLEILTGFRNGLAELAQPGEPYHPFGDGYGASMAQRMKAMSAQLSFERGVDRRIVRRVLAGELVTETVGATTIWQWIKWWQRDGLRGLVDGRRSRGRQGFEALDPRFVAIAEEELARFDGDISVESQNTIERRIRVRLKQEGITDLHLPEKLLQQYLSARMAALGATTRSHKAAAQRRQSSRSSYPALHPGHLAIDVTRADNLVWDDVRERVYSVEVISVISVTPRLIVALRVVPKSATALEAGLALYDAMRPFSMVVDGTTIDDFRWCGIPASLDFGPNPVHAHGRRRVNTDRAVPGVHVKPGVTPTSLRADNGSIFLSAEFRAVLARFGVDLMPSRGSRPIDNPHIERWHESLQRAYQQIPGFKGRRVDERGRMVMRSDDPHLTARELEQHLHRFVALDYHRSPHDGIKIPGLEDGWFTPLERFDMLAPVTGRILVPQHPDLVYDFLPIRWLTLGNAGVEYRGLTYDGDILDELRGLRPGTFREDKPDRVPFLYDPRDRTRLWHRDRFTDRVHELRWREAHLLDAPLTDAIVDGARRLLAARGGNKTLTKKAVMLELIDAVTELTTTTSTEEWHARLAAAQLRHEQARIDHADALAAHHLVEARASGTPVRALPTTTAVPAAVVWDEPWPDYDGQAG